VLAVAVALERPAAFLAAAFFAGAFLAVAFLAVVFFAGDCRVTAFLDARFAPGLGPRLAAVFFLATAITISLSIVTTTSGFKYQSTIVLRYY
jgi:hypothetical protein